MVQPYIETAKKGKCGDGFSSADRLIHVEPIFFTLVITSNEVSSVAVESSTLLLINA